MKCINFYLFNVIVLQILAFGMGLLTIGNRLILNDIQNFKNLFTLADCAALFTKNHGLFLSWNEKMDNP